MDTKLILCEIHRFNVGCTNPQVIQNISFQMMQGNSIWFPVLSLIVRIGDNVIDNLLIHFFDFFIS